MNNSNACEAPFVNQKATLEATLDQVVDSVFREVSHYRINLCRLIAILETPRPCAEKTGSAMPPPPTLDVALSVVHEELVKANDLLNHTIKRLEAQVGELKLLP